jgi:autotransporter-associated beta strand protein
LDASGGTGGGRIRVGGDFHGANADVRNAEQLVVQAGASIKADATVSGDGGQVVLWSDDATRFRGQLSARGGAQGGNGGLAEVSGKRFLDFAGQVDTRAPRGNFGLLLLDPNVIDINDTGGVNVTGSIGFDLLDISTSVLRASGANSISSLLGSTSVSLAANNTITVSSAVNAPGGGTLTLQAGGNITVGAAITAGSIALQSRAGGNVSGTGRVAVNANLTATGTVSLSNFNGADNGSGIHSINGTISAPTVSLDGSATWTGSGAITHGSTLNLNLARGTFTLAGASSIADLAQVDVATGATLVLAGTDVFGSLSGGGNVTLASNSTLTVGAVASSEFSGNLTGGNGNSDLIKAGAGTTLTLSGTGNTYGGETQVNAGTLRIRSGGTVGAGEYRAGQPDAGHRRWRHRVPRRYGD